MTVGLDNRLPSRQSVCWVSFDFKKQNPTQVNLSKKWKIHKDQTKAMSQDGTETMHQTLSLSLPTLCISLPSLHGRKYG